MVVREFHPLRVAAVERLCADAVSVSFEVPGDTSGTVFNNWTTQSSTVSACSTRC